MRDVVRKLRLVVAAAMLAAAGVLAYSTVVSRPAGAQVLKGPRGLVTAGPIQLENGEDGLIGVLLPAVQNNAMPFRLALLNRDGKTLTEIAVPPPSAGGGRYTAFFDVFFTANTPGGGGGGTIQVVNHKTNAVVFTAGQQDGMIIVVCLPAVQDNGIPIWPTTGSVQIITGGARGQIVGMCDGSA